MTNRYDELLDLGRNDPLDLTDRIIRYEDTVVYQNAALTADSSEIQMETRSSSSDNFQAFCDSYLIVKHQIVKAIDATAYADAIKVTIPNVWGCFGNGTFHLNGAEASTCTNPFEVSTLMTSWVRSDSSIMAHADAIGFFPAAKAPADPFDDARNAASRLVYNASTVVYTKLYLRDIFPFLNVRKALRFAQASLRLTFNNSKYSHFILNGTTGPAVPSRVLINDVRWVVPQIRPSMPEFAALSRAAASGEPIPFNFQDIYVKQKLSLTDGLINDNVLSNAKRPRAIIARATLATQRTDPKIDPMLSHPRGLIGPHFVTINERQYPSLAYNWSEGGGHREYETICRAFGKDPLNPNADPFINFKMFTTTHTYLYYDCSMMDDSALLSSGQSGSLVNHQAKYASIAGGDTDMTYFIIYDKQMICREVEGKLLLTIPAAKVETMASL